MDITFSSLPTWQYSSKTHQSRDHQIKPSHRSPNLVHEHELRDSFIQMAKIDTGATPIDKLPKIVKHNPTTKGQKVLAKMLVKELKHIPGIKDIHLNNHGVLTATLPANIPHLKSNAPTIGLIAHLDTNYDVPTHNIQPMLHRHYKGGDIQLPKDGTVIAEKDLESFWGEDIITSDGSTLLGADDKAGIAIIMETLKIFSRNPDLKHPTIKIAFTPDEENQAFIKKFDIKGFGASYAYTVDGGRFNNLGVRSFASHKGDIIFEGFNTHPGYAKGKLINALDMTADFIKKIPQNEKPETTEGYEGYYNIWSMEGDKSRVKLVISAVDFEEKEVYVKTNHLKKWAEEIQEKYPGSKVTVNIKPFLSNMHEFFKQKPEVIENAKKGIEKTIQQINSGSIYLEPPTRGATDGTTLTIKGLPTPNLPAGEMNAHAKNEFVSLQEMARCTLNVVNTMTEWAHYIQHKHTEHPHTLN